MLRPSHLFFLKQCPEILKFVHLLPILRVRLAVYSCSLAIYKGSHSLSAGVHSRKWPRALGGRWGVMKSIEGTHGPVGGSISKASSVAHGQASWWSLRSCSGIHGCQATSSDCSKPLPLFHDPSISQPLNHADPGQERGGSLRQCPTQLGKLGTQYPLTFYHGWNGGLKESFLALSCATLEEEWL